MSANTERRVRVRGREERDSSFKKQILRGLVRFFVIAILLLVTWYGTRLSLFSLSTVTVEGGETISHDEIQALVERELEGTYFSIIPKRFTYLYPHDRILEVLEKIPRIHSIVIDPSSRTVLDVSFDEYVPHALWCVYEKYDAPCYFLDSRGYAFAEAPTLSGGTLVRHSIEGSEEIVEGTVIDQSKLASIDAFLTSIEDSINLRVSTVVYKSNGDINFLVNGGGAIFTSGERDFVETFENLKTLLSSHEFQHIEPGNFKYIDVRFGNKIFVNEELEPAPTVEEASTTPESADDLSQ